MPFPEAEFPWDLMELTNLLSSNCLPSEKELICLINR